MERMISLLLILTAGFSFANAQTKQAKPEEKSIVNKEFDENGNLIKYDSTFVWSWGGDSTFQFQFPMNEFFSGKNFPGFDEMFADSVFVNHFNHLPFGLNNEEFFSQFGQQFPDSAFSQQFEFYGDSAFVSPFSFGNDFLSKDFEKLHEALMRQFGDIRTAQPQFESQEQAKAWQELMEKQQKEKEELLKKWKKD